MTKLKNTKKGMAKKALSISLVAAMLATSNVPVWAAEDIFSDNSAAVEAEAFSDETTVEPAVAVEEADDSNINLQSIGDAYTATFGTDSAPFPTTIEWGSAAATVALDVKDIDGATALGNPNLKYVWKDAKTDLAVTQEATAIAAIPLPVSEFSAKESVGNAYYLYVYDASGDWTAKSDNMVVTAKDITQMGLTIALASGASTAYDDGKQVKAAVSITGTLTNADFTLDYTGNPDLVNSGSVVTVTATPINQDAYMGTLSYSYSIGSRTATSSDFKAEYIKNSYEYTGADIIPEKTDIRITDIHSGKTIDNAVTNVVADGTAPTQVGSGYKAKATVDLTKFSNYNGTNPQVVVTGSYSIIARDLNKCTATVTPVKATGSKANVTAANVTIKDANGKTITLTSSDIDVSVPDNAVSSGSYTVTIKPATGNKNVTGSVTATLVIYAEDFGTITYDPTATGEMTTKVEYFTGSQITKDVTKIKGHLKDASGKLIDANDYDIEFGENINAGATAGIVWVVGKRSFEGYRQKLTFEIKPAKIKSATADDVVYNASIDDKKPEDYKASVVITAHNDGDTTKEWTLKEGTDYTVSYAFTNNKNEVNPNALKATVTYTDQAMTNYSITNKTQDVNINIVNKSIKDTDIRMEKTSYEYTGAAVKPQYKVYDGNKVLKEGTDYVVVNTIGGKDVGTATLVITGAQGSSYNTNTVAKATYEVTPVSADKVALTYAAAQYDGTQQKPAVTVKLNGNTVTSQFDVAYGENINAGDSAGTVTLTPKSGNKNFTDTKSGTFKINPAVLAGGTLTVYNEKGLIVNMNTASFDYDGKAHEFAKVVYKPATQTGSKVVTENDYEIIYKDNISGKSVAPDLVASIIVVAKGNYVGGTTYEDANDVETKSVVSGITGNTFKILSATFVEKEVSVSNAEYGEGYPVSPVVVVKDGDKVLKEGVDYKLTYPAGTVRTNVTSGKTLSVIVQGINGYASTTAVTKTWGIDKKNVANTDITATLDKDGKANVTVMNGNVKVDVDKNFDVVVNKDNTVTVTAKTGNKNYVGSKTVDAEGKDPAEKPVAPTIQQVKVVGNKATVILAGDTEGSTGYDYVISKSKVFTDKASRVAVKANILSTQTTFQYLEQDMYYAYLHSWKRVDGKKVFSEWSNAYPFSVSAITPEEPTVTNVKVTGNTVKVTYTKSANATGYDLVLGSAVKKVNGEMRPVQYGKLVKKVYNGNTVTATFKNVPKGTYYAGLHAYNRTSANNGKVFSPWSNTRKAIVK